MTARPLLLRTALTRFQQFFQAESASGLLLLGCAVLALIWANSQWAASYEACWQTPVSLGVGAWQFTLDLRHWINDGLMALFFFIVGLEIKRELLVGELSKPGQAALPLLGALGGMVSSGLVFLLFNHVSDHARGWGIPVATDIAFALAVLALLGPRVPLGLKVFLAALAIADDLGAVVVIALFYRSQLNVAMLSLAAAGLALAGLANLVGVTRRWPYVVIGLVVWFAMLQSGINATVAGVLLALCIPARARLDTRGFIASGKGLLKQLADLSRGSSPEDDLRQPLSQQQSEVVSALESNCEDIQLPLERFERSLHAPVSYVVMPLFALANAGVSLAGLSLGHELLSPISLGILAGKVLGKQAGIMLLCWLGVRLRWAALPGGVSWPQLYGVAWVCGIGFTMSLFIAGLAFPADPAALATAKLAILLGSAIAGVGGYAILRWTMTARST